MKEFFEVIGWLLIVMTMGSATIAGGLMALNNLGKYNIGGVQNEVTTKIITVVMLIILVACWFALFKNAPFTLSMKD